MRLASLIVLAACASPPAPRPAEPVVVTDPEDRERIRQLELRIAELERLLAEARERAIDPPPPVATAPSPAPTPLPPRRYGPDPARVYAIPLDDSPTLGPAHAPVTIVAAVQFPEPFTNKAWPTLKAILAKHKDVRLVIKSFVVHPKHTRSTIAACAAAYQGDLDKMQEAIYLAAQQPDPLAAQPAYGLREIVDGEARELARALRLDLKQYDRDLPICEAGQTRDLAMFRSHGQGAVPVFWINGRPLSGAQPLESFEKVIAEERAKWKAAKAGGATLADYYETVIQKSP